MHPNLAEDRIYENRFKGPDPAIADSRSSLSSEEARSARMPQPSRPVALSRQVLSNQLADRPAVFFDTQQVMHPGLPPSVRVPAAPSPPYLALPMPHNAVLCIDPPFTDLLATFVALALLTPPPPILIPTQRIVKCVACSVALLPQTSPALTSLSTPLHPMHRYLVVLSRWSAPVGSPRRPAPSSSRPPIWQP